MTDEVELGSGVGSCGQMGCHLLYPVFAADGDSRGNGGADGVVGLHLGGRAEGYFLRIPPGGKGRGGDPILYLFNSVFQFHV